MVDHDVLGYVGLADCLTKSAVVDPPKAIIAPCRAPRIDDFESVFRIRVTNDDERMTATRWAWRSGIYLLPRELAEPLVDHHPDEYRKIRGHLSFDFRYILNVHPTPIGDGIGPRRLLHDGARDV